MDRCNWNGTAVKTGEEELEILKSEYFDVILLDLVMPGMSGAETFRDIRKVDPDVPVVIVTACKKSADY